MKCRVSIVVVSAWAAVGTVACGPGQKPAGHPQLQFVQAAIMNVEVLDSELAQPPISAALLSFRSPESEDRSRGWFLPTGGVAVAYRANRIPGFGGPCIPCMEGECTPPPPIPCEPGVQLATMWISLGERRSAVPLRAGLSERGTLRLPALGEVTLVAAPRSMDADAVAERLRAQFEGRRARPGVFELVPGEICVGSECSACERDGACAGWDAARKLNPAAESVERARLFLVLAVDDDAGPSRPHGSANGR